MKQISLAFLILGFVVLLSSMLMSVNEYVAMNSEMRGAIDCDSPGVVMTFLIVGLFFVLLGTTFSKYRMKFRVGALIAAAVLAGLKFPSVVSEVMRNKTESQCN